MGHVYYRDIVYVRRGIACKCAYREDEDGRDERMRRKIWSCQNEIRILYHDFRESANSCSWETKPKFGSAIGRRALICANA